MKENNEYDLSLEKTLKTSKPLSDLHVCNFCETKFNNLNSLNLHYQLHDNNKNFTCLMCKEVFLDLQQLKLHDLRHSIEEAHEDISDIEHISFSGFILCSVCGEKFSCDEELINHCVIHPLKDPDIVESKISDIEDLNPDSNESLSSDEEQINYRILRQEIITPKNGNSHEQLIRLTLIDDHDVQVEEFTRFMNPKNTKDIKKDSIKANNISKKVKVQSNVLGVHPKGSKKKSVQNLSVKMNITSKRIKTKKDSLILNSSDNKQVKCDPSENECKVVSDKVSNLSTKQERKSKLIAIRKKLWNDKIEIPIVKKTSKIVYKCKKCHVVFDNLDALNKHKQKVCSRQNVKVCPNCEKMFTNLNEFNEHCLTHKEITKYSCSYCNEEFTIENLYRQHIIDNHNSTVESQHDCRICGEHFVLKIDFDNHWQKHIHLKKFACCVCQKSFSNLPKFKIHKCLKGVPCKLCKKTFSRSYYLNRHLQNVHKLDVSEANCILPKESNINNQSIVTLNGGKAEDMLQSFSLELPHEDKVTLELENSDVNNESIFVEKEVVSNGSKSFFDKKEVLTNNKCEIKLMKTVTKPVKKTLIKKGSKSNTKSNMSMKRNLDSSTNNNDKPAKKARIKIVKSNEKAMSKAMLLKKKASATNTKTKSKVLTNKLSTSSHQRNQPAKKLIMKSSKKHLPVKKAKNKILNKNVTSKKTSAKSSSVKITKKLMPKKTKSVSALNLQKKLKKSKL